MEPQKRVPTIAILAEKGINLGPAFKTALVEQVAAETVDLTAFLQIVVPYPASHHFDPRKPLLRACRLPPLETASLFLRMVVTERVLKQVAGSEASSEELLLLCQNVRKLAGDGPGTLPPVVQAALDEAACIARFFCVIAADEPATEEDLAVVTDINASRNGAKSLVRMAVLQNTFWNAYEASYKTANVAALTMKPEITSAMEKLEQKTHSALVEAIEKLPQWLDHLRPNMTKPVVEKVFSVMEEMFTEIEELVASGTNWQTALKDFCKTCQFAESMLAVGARRKERAYQRFGEWLQACGEMQSQADAKRVEEELKQVLAVYSQDSVCTMSWLWGGGGNFG